MPARYLKNVTYDEQFEIESLMEELTNKDHRSRHVLETSRDHLEKKNLQKQKLQEIMNYFEVCNMQHSMKYSPESPPLFMSFN
jgi:hypothetical protein